jgi:hypothetical protein
MKGFRDGILAVSCVSEHGVSHPFMVIFLREMMIETSNSRVAS